MSRKLLPLDGLVPARPPAALRERVLGAAREAALRPEAGLIEQLAADRTLRWCGVAIAVLVALNVVVDLGGARGPRPARVAVDSIPEAGAAVVRNDAVATARERRAEIAALRDDLGESAER